MFSLTVTNFIHKDHKTKVRGAVSDLTFSPHFGKRWAPFLLKGWQEFRVLTHFHNFDQIIQVWPKFRRHMIDKREKMSRRDRSEETRRTGNICRALSRGYRGDKTDLLAALMKITCEEQYLQFFFYLEQRLKKKCNSCNIFSVRYHILWRYSSYSTRHNLH